jgi:hypothetical protein
MATPTNLPASFSTGNVLTAAEMNNMRGAFRILQVVVANYATQTTNNTSTYADTGLTASITPQATSNKVLVYVSQNNMYKFSNTQSGCNIRLLRGATNVGQFINNWGFDGTSTGRIHGSACFFLLDSPATTSSVTYKTQFANNTNAAGINIQHDNMNSSIVLLEVSA